jgi:hypothetical protein
MGIFSKIGKGIKKVFSSIGKGIKKQFKRFGKFMGKAGILGQIAMMFVLPGIGNALMSGISGAFGAVVGQTAAQAGAAAASAGAAGAAGATAGAAGAAGASVAGAGATGASAIAGSSVAGAGAAAGTLGQATGMMASKSALIRGAGHVLQAAGNFVKVGSKAFSTVTEGISSFIGEFGKTALNKIPGVNIGSAAPTMGQAWTNVQNSVMKNASGTVEAFNTAIGIEPTAGATKFGTSGYTVPDRVSVDSLKAAMPTEADYLKSISQQPAPLPTEADYLKSISGTPKASNSLLAPSPGAALKVPGSFQDAMQQTVDFGVTPPPTTNFVATTPGPVAATDPSYYDMLKSKATDALKEFSPSSLLDRVQKIPGEFLDNLGNTITKAPETAFYANLNKADPGYNVSTQVIGGNMPVADVASLQQPLASSGQATQYYQGPQRSGTGSYGFVNNDGYGQFMKKFA